MKDSKAHMIGNEKKSGRFSIPFGASGEDAKGEIKVEESIPFGSANAPVKPQSDSSNNKKKD